MFTLPIVQYIYNLLEEDSQSTKDKTSEFYITVYISCLEIPLHYVLNSHMFSQQLCNPNHNPS